MKKIHRVLLALLSFILLSIPFFQWGTGLLLPIAFIPLLLVEDDLATRRKSSGKKGSLIWYGILTFSLFNLFTTYWVYFAHWTGIVAAVLIGTLYMTLVWSLFSWTRRKLGDRLGYAALVFFWITFEFLYLRAQINFPWLVLGNGFANDVRLIQWYEVTGTLGGSLWVLILNILIFRLIKGWRANRSITPNRSRIGWALGVLLIPIAISAIRYISYKEKEDPYEMVVLQPNIDPYLKFNDLPQEQQTAYLLQVADSLVTDQTDYIVGPETFLNNNVLEENIHLHTDIRRLKAFLDRFPEAKLVLGATTYKVYTDPSEFTATSKPLRGTPNEYDSFNSAFQLDASGEIPIYHKSLLVTGVEKMPYTKLLAPLEKLTVNLGGTFRSHGTQEERETFVSPQDGTRVGPVICWESIFGEFVTDYVKEAGAHFLFIVTNDGWWRDTPGHRQHNSYARLRAIETRRSIARSANTGISSLINQRGEELARIGWWERSGLRGELNKNDHLTFYVKHGDYLGRISLFLTVILLLYGLVIRYIRN